jgi:hypothetical protein
MAERHAIQRTDAGRSEGGAALEGCEMTVVMDYRHPLAIGGQYQASTDAWA